MRDVGREIKGHVVMSEGIAGLSTVVVVEVGCRETRIGLRVTRGLNNQQTKSRVSRTLNFSISTTRRHCQPTMLRFNFRSPLFPYVDIGPRTPTDYAVFQISISDLALFGLLTEDVAFQFLGQLSRSLGHKTTRSGML
jgi:hypothetical protein